MKLDWRGKVILSKLAEGCTEREAAAAGISRQAVLKRKNASPEFAQAVAVARETGTYTMSGHCTKKSFIHRT